MKAAWIACLLLLVTAVWMGCAHETTVTTSTSSCVAPDPDYQVDDPACDLIVEEVTVETQRDRCHGLISCTFVVVGEVVALPFRIVGAAFDVVL